MIAEILIVHADWLLPVSQWNAYEQYFSCMMGMDTWRTTSDKHGMQIL
jgi:hypothetical protein